MLPPAVAAVQAAMLSLLLAAITAAQQPQPRRAVPAETSHVSLEVIDVLRIRDFPDRVPIDLSPDGRFVAFTLRNRLRADSANLTAGAKYFSPNGVPVSVAGSDIFVANTRSGQTKNLTGDRGTSWGPAWSPDGRLLCFYSDRDGTPQIWVWDREGDTLRRLSPEQVRPYWGFEAIRWSPDGRSILVKLSPLGVSNEQLARLLPSVSTVAVEGTPSDSTNKATATVFVATRTTDTAATHPQVAINIDSTRSFLNTELSDLAIIDIGTGRVRRIARHARADGYRWSPDGTRVAFTTRQPDNGHGVFTYGAYDLFITDTMAQPRLIVPRMAQEYGQRFSWSPRGDRLTFESGDALHVISTILGATPRQVTTPEQKFVHEYRAPIWLADDTLLEAARDTLWRTALSTGRSTSVLGTPAGQQLLEIVAPADADRLRGGTVLLAVRDRETKRSGFYSVDLKTGHGKMIYEDAVALGATDLVYNLDISSDGRTIIYVAERADLPPELWTGDIDSLRPRRITDLNPAVTSHALGKTRLLRWTSSTGAVLNGALLLPAGYRKGRRYPLVVRVYGGSLLANSLDRFGLQPGVDNMQLLATRGYAVLVPDTPLRIGTPMTDLATDVLPALDSVVAMGVADPERIGVFGHSYGGYSALALLAQSKRFKAGVASGSFSDLFAEYGAMGADGSAVGVSWSEKGQGRMGGSPWEFRERYIQNSPFFFLDRVAAPVLLLHGGADHIEPPARAEETFVALRRLGKGATLVLYKGEDHWPGTWSVANVTDYWARTFQWFGRYLGTSSPRAMTK